MAGLTAKADVLASKFETEWGAFRRLIAAHPLTGFWIGVVAGAIIGFIGAHL